MDDDFALSWEGVLIGGLLGFVIAGSSRPAACELAAEQRADQERSTVDRGHAAYRAAQRFGMTPDLAADIIEAEDVLQLWQDRRRGRQAVHDLRHLRDTGRWVSFWSWTVVWSAIGWLPVMALTAFAAFALLDLDLLSGPGWQMLLLGCWPGLIAAVVAVIGHDRAVARLATGPFDGLHRHGKRWHTHHEVDAFHRHPVGDPDGPVLRC